MSILMAWNAKRLKNTKGGLWENILEVTMKNAPKTSYQHILSHLTRTQKMMNGKKTQRSHRKEAKRNNYYSGIRQKLFSLQLVLYFLYWCQKTYVYILINCVAYLCRVIQLKEAFFNYAKYYCDYYSNQGNCHPVCLSICGTASGDMQFHTGNLKQLGPNDGIKLS